LKVIYTPKGKALEYAPLAVNLYDGCQHGCTYCYAPNVLHKDKTQFIDAKPRPNIIQRLIQESTKHLQGNKGPVLLCFTCDPYMPLEETYGLTRQAITILHNHGFPVSILTKAGKLAQRDFDLLTPQDYFGQTLTFVDGESLNWEPGAALPKDRLKNLEIAHAMGIPTWVSLEPVINPAQSLELIKLTHEYVDVFKVGKWNHDPRAQLIDWADYGAKAVVLLQKLGKSYYLKKDLTEYMRSK